MKKLSIKPQFVLLISEITFLCGLAPNAPETELSGLDKRQLGNIYYKYFGSLPISKTLIENEMKEKWPGGERKKNHECQRAILNILHKINSAMPNNAELIPVQENKMDLSWLHYILTQATINDITIIALTTDVVTEVPVVSNVGVTINGKKFEVAPGNYTPLQLLEMYNEKYVPVDPVQSFMVTCKGAPHEVKMDGLISVRETGYALTFTAPAE
jgi:hypothetical protein